MSEKLLTKKTPLIFHYRQDVTKKSIGATIVYHPESKVFVWSRCSEKDQFSRKRGLQLTKYRYENLKKIESRCSSNPDRTQPYAIYPDALNTLEWVKDKANTIWKNLLEMK